MRTLDPRQIFEQSALEVRGDGKAGGGLVLAFQSLAALFSSLPNMHVQEWPFFSSARRGANIRSFLRVSAKPIDVGCEVTRPVISLLMDEVTGKTVDFAGGVPHGGTFVLNTRRTPEECAKHFHLSGRVMTVPGDDIGTRYLKHPIGNVSAYVAMTEAIGGLEFETVVGTFLGQLKKRRIPEVLLERNREALHATKESIQVGVFDEARPGDHATTVFTGYGELPIGAQTRLRLSQTNHTAAFARSGFRLLFNDPNKSCTGCSHCITNCPEGIIRFQPDEERGVLVTGADVSAFCKLCGECIAVCPEKLFTEGKYEEVWDETVTEARS
ncbi:MAG: 2-oxoacid:acceptor oxidoreductase family protein [Candidatus Eisenbacteria bacterium]|jgi:pyruvate ferredoxin oxidoreductase gamma subunit|nr:2-oxoacid:acceptor oxidoreductase family protein [Candidatus Eisenbacteria bacterium]